MRIRISPVLGAVLASVALAGSLTLTHAAPGKKAPKKKPAVSAAASPALAAAGKKVYDANGCAACHAVGDKGGKIGPDLTHIGKDKAWPAAKLAKVVRDPKATLKSEKMPAYGPDKISDKELKSLVAYMSSLK